MMRTMTAACFFAAALACMHLPGADLPAGAAELNYNLIEFSVQARRDVANDLMQATLFAEAVGSDPAELAAQVNKRIAAAVSRAKAVAGVKVESGSYTSSANYQKGRQEGWRTRAELRLESRDFSALSGLIGQLQGADLQLGAMQFVISPALRSQVEAELTKEALAAFQERAGLIRQSMAAQASKTVTIRIDGQAPQPPRPLFRARAMTAMEESAPPPPAEGGTSEIVIAATGTVQMQ
jgi:predicted secreted protein